MTTHVKLNEFNHAEDPARRLLERLGWTYVPRESLTVERGGEREVLLDSILRSALLRLNEWLTVAQADRVIFELESINAVGMARNQAVHEYLTFGMPLNVDGPGGGTRAPSASSTSTTPRAVSTSSWSPPSFGCAGAASGTVRRTMSGWSSPTWSSS